MRKTVGREEQECGRKADWESGRGKVILMKTRPDRESSKDTGRADGQQDPRHNPGSPEHKLSLRLGDRDPGRRE